MDGLLCLWTLEKSHPIRLYPEEGHTGPIHLLEFHPNGNYLASAQADHTVHLCNFQHEPALVRVFNGHRHQVSALRFSPNGHFLATGCWNGEFILWDIQNNMQIAHLALHQQAISCIEFSPLTGTLLLIGSLDGSISLWNCFMITKMYDEKLLESMDTALSPNKILLNHFRTKATPIWQMRFSRENILYALGLMDRVALNKDAV
jgi:WD40 repeat protein